jgi:hypothetical protein
VGEARRDRTQRHQALVPVHDVARRPALDRGSAQKMGRHREPLADRVAEVDRRQLEELAVGHRPRRARVHLGRPLLVLVEEGGERSGVGTPVVGPEQLDLAALHPARHGERARQQHQEAGRGQALGVDDRPRVVGHETAPLGQPRRLLVGQPIEEEQRAQVFGPERLLLDLGHRCSK